MLKEENAELLIDGKKVSNDYEFTADNEKMTVEIAFTFDGSSLGGKSLVTFEELYDMTNPDEPKKVQNIRTSQTMDRLWQSRKCRKSQTHQRILTRRIHHLRLRQVTAQKQATIPISMLTLPCSVFPA